MLIRHVKQGYPHVCCGLILGVLYTMVVAFGIDNLPTHIVVKAPLWPEPHGGFNYKKINMAQRRMFSNRIANSAKFLQMPVESQLLYFHLILRADDDGIVESYPVMRLLGIAPDNFRILEAKDFIKKLNDDQVVVITDWLEHNTIRADRKVDSMYKNLLPSEIKTIEPKPRSDVRNNSRRIGGQSTDGIGKVKLSKDSTTSKKREPSAEAVRLATLLYEWRKKNTDGRERKPNINNWATDIDKMIRLDKLQPAEIEYVINWCQQDSFWKQNIKSGNKLRIQYASLYLRIKEQKNGHK